MESKKIKLSVSKSKQLNKSKEDMLARSVEDNRQLPKIILNRFINYSCKLCKTSVKKNSKQMVNHLHNCKYMHDLTGINKTTIKTFECNVCHYSTSQFYAHKQHITSYLHLSNCHNTCNYYSYICDKCNTFMYSHKIFIINHWKLHDKDTYSTKTLSILSTFMANLFNEYNINPSIIDMKHYYGNIDNSNEVSQVVSIQCQACKIDFHTSIDDYNMHEITNEHIILKFLTPKRSVNKDFSIRELVSADTFDSIQVNNNKNVKHIEINKSQTNLDVDNTDCIILDNVQKVQDVNKNVQSILNKITPDNRSALTDRFKALPIDTYECLEKTVDLVFEKAIKEQSFAPLYASLCSAMQTVQVVSAEGAKISFKKLIISKCQSLFELYKAQETDSAKKLAEINSCKDPEKKKELQLVYEENERRLHKRFEGNCRFMGELFKQNILTQNIMLYCIVNLITKHVEESLECLCILLKTVGKKLEQSNYLNETFDKLKALTSKEMKSKIPSRIRFMIQDVIDLRRDTWIPGRNDSKPKLINEIENYAKNEAMEQSMALSYRDRSEKPQDHHCGDDNKFRGGDNKSRHGNDNEWNIVQNTKYKQQSYTTDQSKIQGFKETSNVHIESNVNNKFSSKNSQYTKYFKHKMSILNVLRQYKDRIVKTLSYYCVACDFIVEEKYVWDQHNQIEHQDDSFVTSIYCSTCSMLIFGETIEEHNKAKEHCILWNFLQSLELVEKDILGKTALLEKTDNYISDEISTENFDKIQLNNNGSAKESQYSGNNCDKNGNNIINEKDSVISSITSLGNDQNKHVHDETTPNVITLHTDDEITSLPNGILINESCSLSYMKVNIPEKYKSEDMAISMDDSCVNNSILTLVINEDNFNKETKHEVTSNLSETITPSLSIAQQNNQNRNTDKLSDDDAYGNYVAQRLRHIDSTHLKQNIKLEIDYIFYKKLSI